MAFFGNLGLKMNKESARLKKKGRKKMKDDLFTCKEVEGGVSIKYHLQEKDITKIVVPSTVEGKRVIEIEGIDYSPTSIEYMAFCGCASLVEVKMHFNLIN